MGGLYLAVEGTPKEVPIYRKEVYIQIQEANKASVDADGMEALKNLFG